MSPVANARYKLFSLVTGIVGIVCCALFSGCASSPLKDAIRRGDLRAVEGFLKYDPKVDMQVRKQALCMAAYYGQNDIIKLLLDQGVDINIACEAPELTALHVAVFAGRYSTVSFLIQRGADLSVKARNGETPLDIAEKVRKDPGISRLLSDARNDQAKLVNEHRLIAEPSARAANISEARLAVISDVDDVPDKGKINNNGYAVIVGIEQYRQGLSVADYAAHDAQMVAEYFAKTLGYRKERIVTLSNEHASYVDLVKYFEKWLPNNVEPGSTVFVYYSGHGAPNPKTGDAYLVPYDGDPSFIEETGYSLKRMYAALGKLPAKEVIVALDSCFSGAGGRSVLAKGARPLVMNLNIAAAPARNMTILAASSGEQISSTYDEKGHGLFTYFLLKGIKNEDVVRQDGSLDIATLFDYVKPQVTSIARKKYNNEQTPQLIGARK